MLDLWVPCNFMQSFAESKKDVPLLPGNHQFFLVARTLLSFFSPVVIELLGICVHLSLRLAHSKFSLSLLFFVSWQAAVPPQHFQKARTAAGLATRLPNKILTMMTSSQQKRQKYQPYKSSHSLLHLSAGVFVHSLRHAPITASSLLSGGQSGKQETEALTEEGLRMMRKRKRKRKTKYPQHHLQ